MKAQCEVSKESRTGNVKIFIVYKSLGSPNYIAGVRLFAILPYASLGYMSSVEYISYRQYFLYMVSS
jgi:hypothetical protein